MMSSYYSTCFAYFLFIIPSIQSYKGFCSTFKFRNNHLCSSNSVAEGMYGKANCLIIAFVIVLLCFCLKFLEMGSSFQSPVLQWKSLTCFYQLVIMI